MGLITAVRRLFVKKEDKKERTFFHCPIGDVDAEVFSLSSEEIETLCQNERGNPQPHLYVASAFINRQYAFLIHCPRMNYEWKDDGGCFCIDTDTPGTCLGMPVERNHYRPFNHKGCPYIGMPIEEVKAKLIELARVKNHRD